MHKGKFKYFIISIISVLTCFVCLSQVDSLEKMLEQVEGDEKFELLITSSKEYWFIDPAKSVELAEQAFKIGEEKKNDIQKARALNRIGLGFYFLEKYNPAYEYYRKSLILSKEINYSDGISRASNNIGLIYDALGSYDTAIDYYYISLDIEKRNNNIEGVAATLINIGNIYYYLQDYDKALDLYNNCLNICKKLDQKQRILDCYTNLGSLFFEINKFDTAIEYSTLAYKLSLEIGNIDNQAANLNNIGNVHFEKQQYETALEFYNKALKIQKENKYLWSETNTLRNIGGVYNALNQKQNAFKYFDEALEKAKQINAKKLIMALYSDMSEYYENNNDYIKALEFHKLYTNLNDVLYNKESRKQIAEIEKKYEFQNKEQQLELITKENEVKELQIKTQQYIIFIGASISLLILALVFIFYNRSLSNKKARILLEEKNTSISEQKIILEKTISELKESEEKQKSLIENILDGIFIIQNDRLIYSNEAIVDITGYSIEELHNMTFKDIIVREDLEMIINNYKARMQGKDIPTSYEFRLRHKNGQVVYVILSVGLISYHGEKAILGTIKDITGQKKYEDELIHEKEKAEQATQSKSMFLAGMSHEIRNQMSSIIGITEVLEETDLSAEQKEYLRVVSVSSNNLLNIINNILDFSKIEARQVILEPVRFFLPKLLSEVISLHELKAKNNGLYLKSKIASDTPDIFIGDPTRLSQILINLVNNALKFTDKGGVTIEIEIDGQKDNTLKKGDGQCKLKFKVTDTGVGISKDSRHKLFKPFSQTHAAVERKNKGTGLGLAISKQLVELMEGEIGVDSEINKGSTFWFTAKLINPLSKSGKSSKSITYPDDETSKRLKVLIVEDNILNQQLTSNILVKEGFITDIAENGKIGLDLFKQKKYEVVLMDIQMPVMDGIQATRLIRKYEANKNFKQTKIIAVTAHAKEGEKQKLFDAGMDLYLSKPFKPSQLISMINSLNLS